MNGYDIKWDICPHFHGMSDMGYKGDGTREFGRAHTYSGECYAFPETKCRRNGNCVTARTQNWSKVGKNSW